MNLHKKISLLLMAALPHLLFAQTEQVAMADRMRSNGKIYIVVAVCLTILAGLFLYVYRLDKKINRLEKTAGDK